MMLVDDPKIQGVADILTNQNVSRCPLAVAKCLWNCASLWSLGKQTHRGLIDIHRHGLLLERTAASVDRPDITY